MYIELDWILGQGDILVLADVPLPWEIEIGLNMNAKEKKVISSEVSKCILQSTTPFHVSDFVPEK